MEGRKEGKLSRLRVFGLKQNPWTATHLRIAIRQTRRGTG